VPEIAATTAVLGRHGEAQQVVAPGLEPGFAVDLPGLVPLCLLGQAFTLEETARGFTQHFVVFTVDGTVDVHRNLHWVARQASAWFVSPLYGRGVVVQPPGSGSAPGRS
jgi:hypothetical protein